MAWMEPEGIMLSEVSQRWRNTVSSHIYMESKQTNPEKRDQTGDYQEWELVI